MSLNVFDLQGRVGIDTKKFVDGVKSAEKVNNELKKELDSTSPHVKALEDRIDQATKAVNEAQKKVEDLSDAYNKSAKKAGYNAEETKKLNDELTKAEKELHKAESEVKGLEKELEKEAKSAEEGSEETKKLGNEVRTAGTQAEKSTPKFAELASTIKDGLATAAKIGTTAILGAGAAVTALVKQSVGEYSEYEQLVGGVDKLFGEASKKVQENAENAYATSGLSANEYLQQVTGFAASLIQATGRGEQQDIDDLKEALDEEYLLTKEALSDRYDEVKAYWNEQIKASKAAKDGEADMLTKQRDEELKALKKQNEEELRLLKAHQKDVISETERANNQSTTTFESLEKAADLADVAMKAISDNVNTFGTDMSSVQNAFQGFAKQNYTMLDNLRLGYGGTKEEMERLIDDANEYAESIGEASDLQMNSFADIVTAIDLIQRKQGIAGTTAKEAAHTITGSIGAVRASWHNLVVEMAKEDGDISGAFKILGDNVGGVIENMLPKVENALGGVGELISSAAPAIMDGIRRLLPKVLPSLVKTATSLAGTVGNALLTALPEMVDMGRNMLANLAYGLENSEFEGGGILGKALNSIVNDLPVYVQYAEMIVSNLANKLLEVDAGELAKTLGELIRTGINGITDLVSDIDWEQLSKNVADFINNFPWSDIAHDIITLLGTAIKQLPNIAKTFYEEIDGDALMDAIMVLAAPKLLRSLTGYIKSSAGVAAATEAGSAWAASFIPPIEAALAGVLAGTAIRQGLEKKYGKENTYDVLGKIGFGSITGPIGTAGVEIAEFVNNQKEKKENQNTVTYTGPNGKEYQGYKFGNNGQQSLLAQKESAKLYNNEVFSYYMNGKLQSAYKYDEFGNYTTEWEKYGKLAKFGDGGRVTQPTLAIVGEKEPETMVPDSKWGQIGNTTNYITINVEGYSIKNDEEFTELLSSKLADLGIRQQRALGGAAW